MNTTPDKAPLPRWLQPREPGRTVRRRQARRAGLLGRHRRRRSYVPADQVTASIPRLTVGDARPAAVDTLAKKLKQRPGGRGVR